MKLRRLFLILIIASAVFCSSCTLIAVATCSGKMQDRELRFELNDTETGYILSEVGVDLDNVIIPEEYMGLPVVGIGDEAFYPYLNQGCSNGNMPLNPSCVVIPASVKFIGEDAFEQNSIYAVVYKGSIEEWMSIKIKSSPFSKKTEFFVNDNQKVTSVTVPDGIKKLPDYCFDGLGGLESIAFSGDMEELGLRSLSGTGIKELTLPDGVTTVGSFAFRNCVNLENATLSANLSKIPAYAFDGCVSLKRVNLKCGIEAMGEYAFSDCSSLEDIDLSFSCMTVIPYGAFYGCSSLNVIVIPESVSSIDEKAFYNCRNLFEVFNLSSLKIVAGENTYGDVSKYAVAVYKSLDDDRVITARGEFVFAKNDQKNYLVKYTGSEKNIVLPENFDGENYAIKQYVFSFTDKFESVTLPKSVIEIENFAFYKCEKLTKIIGGEGVKEIGESVFEKCEKLNSDIPANATQIGKNAYKDCISLTSVTIPEGTECINEGVFSGCTALKQVVFPNSLIKIDTEAFRECRSLGDISFGENMDHIGYGSFYNCGMTAVKFNGRIIEHLAFEHCDNLSTVDLGDRLQSIADFAFSGCNRLKEIELPASLNILSPKAFLGSGLTKITVDGGNAKYLSRQNCIIERESKEIVLGCTGSKIPEDGSAESIGRFAFANCYFTEFTVPDCIKTIGERAFDNCRRLETIHIGSGAESIDDGILAFCNQLTDIYFDGSRNKFMQLINGNNLLVYNWTVTVHCNDTTFEYTEQ